MINLRGANPRWGWWHYERRVCEKMGIAHRDVRMNSRRLPTRAMLLDLLQAFDDAKQPALLKCSGGQDRTSFAAALYLLHTRGSGARGDAEMQFAHWPYLHLPKSDQRWLKNFVRFVEEQIGARALRDWIATDYEPEAFKMWLEARGLGDAFRGLHVPPKPRAVTSDARNTA